MLALARVRVSLYVWVLFFPLTLCVCVCVSLNGDESSFLSSPFYILYISLMFIVMTSWAIFPLSSFNLFFSVSARVRERMSVFVYVYNIYLCVCMSSFFTFSIQSETFENKSFLQFVCVCCYFANALLFSYIWFNCVLWEDVHTQIERHTHTQTHFL